MPNMGKLPKLLGRRYKEYGALAHSAEHVIDWEIVPPHANVEYMAGNIVMMGNAEVNNYNTMWVEVNAWWLPVYGSDQAAAFSTKAALKTYYDRMVPKAQSIRANETWSPDGAGTPDAELHLGDADTNLRYQMGKLNLKVLTNASDPARLYHRRLRLGWMEKKAFRTGNSTMVKYAHNLPFNIPTGLQTTIPGYIIFVLTNPADVVDNHFEESDTFIPTNEFEEWDFLAPQWSLFSESKSLGGGDLNTWRRWSDSFVIEQGTATYRQSLQTALDIRTSREIVYRREVWTPAVVAPQPS